MERGDNMDEFDLTILTYQETKSDFFKDFKELENLNVVTDLALLRDANENGIFWTSSPFLGSTLFIVTNTKGGGGYFNRSSTRGIGILPVLVSSSTLWEQLLKSKIKIGSHLYQVSFLEYPQDVANIQEQVFLKGKLDANELLPTGKVYTFDSATFEAESEYVSFQGKKYPEYSYKNKKYIYVDTNRYNSVYLSSGYETTMGENLFIKVEPVLWWMDMEKERLISTKVLLGGIQFQGGEEAYDHNFRRTFLQYYLDTYMKRDLRPSVIKEKSEIFDSSESLKRLIYKNYGKRR